MVVGLTVPIVFLSVGAGIFIYIHHSKSTLLNINRSNKDIEKNHENTNKNDSGKYTGDGPAIKAIKLLHSIRDSAYRGKKRELTTEEIDLILELLGKNDMFTPDLEKLKDQTGYTLDEDTQEWLRNSVFPQQQQQQQQQPQQQQQLRKKGNSSVPLSIKSIKSIAFSDISSSNRSGETHSERSFDKGPHDIMMMDGKNSVTGSKTGDRIRSSRFNTGNTGSDTTSSDHDQGMVNLTLHSYILDVTKVLARYEFQDLSKFQEILNSSFHLWEFDTLGFTEMTNGHPILFIGSYVADKMGVLQHFNIDPGKFKQWLLVIFQVFHFPLKFTHFM